MAKNNAAEIKAVALDLIKKTYEQSEYLLSLKLCLLDNLLLLTLKKHLSDHYVGHKCGNCTAHCA